jgi:hypothetical protein
LTKVQFKTNTGDTVKDIDITNEVQNSSSETLPHHNNILKTIFIDDYEKMDQQINLVSTQSMLQTFANVMPFRMLGYSDTNRTKTVEEAKKSSIANSISSFFGSRKEAGKSKRRISKSKKGSRKAKR